jgi:hypothetical protein
VNIRVSRTSARGLWGSVTILEIAGAVGLAIEEIDVVMLEVYIVVNVEQ